RAQLGAADRLRRLVELGAHPEEFLLGEHELGAAALQLGDALGGAGGTGGRVVAFLLPGGAPLDDLLQAAGPALEAAQLLETRLGLAVPLAVVLGGHLGQLGADLRLAFLALGLLRAQALQLLEGVLAPRDALVRLLDRLLRLRPGGLGSNEFIGLLRLELVEALLEPLAVLDQRVPLVPESADDCVELRAERPLAGGADPVRTGLFELLDLLLQLPGALPVRLQLGARLLAALDPVALRSRDRLLGLGEPFARGGQLGPVLLEEPRRLLEFLQA